MSPEATAFLSKAADIIGRADLLIEKGFADEAGRAAYLAGFHAAQSFIFEKRGRSPKTHAGPGSAA